MKKGMIAMGMLLLMAVPAHAQMNVDKKSTPKQRLNQFLKETRRGIEKTGKTISDLINTELQRDSDDMLIDGVRYMPIYKVNLWKNGSADMLALCKKDFAKRYPHATIVSVAIPQKDWEQTAVREKQKITSYRRTVWCYVIAKDGTEGYINVRYIFRQEREAGKTWLTPEGYWPHLDRTDVIPNVHYQKLIRSK